MGTTAQKSAKQVVTEIGREYVERDELCFENDDLTERLYGEIEEICRRLCDEIPVPVVFQSRDPYSGYEDMARSVGQEQMLRVYNQHTEHPYLSHKGQLAFRAVHDWYGHLDADVDFTPEGEYKKWLHMKDHFTPLQNRVMFAEVVGQVGVVHYLPDGFADDRYEQRAFIAPDRMVRKMDWAVGE